MARSLQELVGLVAEWMRSHPDNDERELIPSLVKCQLDEFLAKDLIVFVPLAFGRALLKRTGVNLPETYLIYGPDGQQPERHRLLDHPVFCEAYRAAEDCYSRGVDDNTYLAIAGRSPEVRNLNKALDAGSDLKELVCLEPFMKGVRPPKRKPHWWDFWERLR
jgi:hypothetical protein